MVKIPHILKIEIVFEGTNIRFDMRLVGPEARSPALPLGNISLGAARWRRKGRPRAEAAGVPLKKHGS